VKVAYDGTRFHGSQRQPGLRTVEGDLLHALTRIGALESAESARFLAASRTDAGVSAAGNVFAFNTGIPRERLLQALNPHLRDLWALAVAEVPEDFHPRKSHRRKYRYHLRRGGFDEARFREALALFPGTHDFTGFARIEAGQDPVRLLESVTVHERGPYLDVELTAPSFLWNQVRRIVGAGLSVARGGAAVEDVRDVLARRRTLDLGLAPPEPLVLLDVAYAFPLEPDTGYAARLLGPAEEELTLRLALLRDFKDPAGPREPE